MKSDDVYLARICDSARKIARATAGQTEETFSATETISASVILWLMQIGEVSKRLSPETKSRFAVNWKEIAGFRDVAVHEYFKLFLADVWLTATKDIPELARALGCDTR